MLTEEGQTDRQRWCALLAGVISWSEATSRDSIRCAITKERGQVELMIDLIAGCEFV